MKWENTIIKSKNLTPSNWVELDLESKISDVTTFNFQMRSFTSKKSGRLMRSKVPRIFQTPLKIRFNAEFVGVMTTMMLIL